MSQNLEVIYLGVVSLATACLLALSGMYWQAGMALLLVGLSLYLGVRELRNPTLSTEHFLAIMKERMEEERPYTAADFPCPDILPGREAIVDSQEPIPFAVVIPRSDDPRELEKVGVRLQEWQASHPCVTEIIGLEQMLSGNQPEMRVEWFCWPESVEDLFRSPKIGVALVFIEAHAADKVLGDELLDQLKDCSCEVQSFRYYDYVGR
jgi:hypothetical protein